MPVDDLVRAAAAAPDDDLDLAAAAVGVRRRADRRRRRRRRTVVGGGAVALGLAVAAVALAFDRSPGPDTVIVATTTTPSTTTETTTTTTLAADPLAALGPCRALVPTDDPFDLEPPPSTSTTGPLVDDPEYEASVRHDSTPCTRALRDWGLDRLGPGWEARPQALNEYSGGGGYGSAQAVLTTDGVDLLTVYATVGSPERIDRLGLKGEPWEGIPAGIRGGVIRFGNGEVRVVVVRRGRLSLRVEAWSSELPGGDRVHPLTEAEVTEIALDLAESGPVQPVE